MLITTAGSAGDYKYEVLLVICCLMGLFDGCFVTLIGPIAFDLCGPRGACQAIGSLLSLFSLPVTVGPPVAGIIHDKVKTPTPTLLYFCVFPAWQLLPRLPRCWLTSDSWVAGTLHHQV